MAWLAKSDAPKLRRWWLFTCEFDLTIQHIPGPSNVVADALSRMPTTRAAPALAALTVQATRLAALVVAHSARARAGHLSARAIPRDITKACGGWPSMTPDVRAAITPRAP